MKSRIDSLGRSDRGAGFTLVELLVVIGIIAMLIAVLLPALAASRQQATNVKCLSNLRQLAQFAFAYCAENNGAFPLAYWDYDKDRSPEASWDYIIEHINGVRTVQPGILFGRRGGTSVAQCPSYDRSIPGGDAFTGYNYNTSYIGGRFTQDGNDHRASAKLGKLRDPVHTALFGDGEYASGPNKYMRAPFPSPEDPSSAEVHASGSQGFRHRNATNVAFADGHAESVVLKAADRFPTTGVWASNPTLRLFSGKLNGFLSPTNAAYDLK